LVFWDARARVANCEGALVWRSLDSQAHGVPGRAEFNGVAHDVVEYLKDALAIADHSAVRAAVVHQTYEALFGEWG